MKILLTGATGYIGKRLLPHLIRQGHIVVCCVRDRKRFNPPDSLIPYFTIIEIDFLCDSDIHKVPDDIDIAYYLIHSMSSSFAYDRLEEKAAQNFCSALQDSKVSQVIYLSGIVNESKLSKHLASRKHVEEILSSGPFNLTTFRAGIIIGSGSASFEIIRDLVEKLPLMVAPKWLNTKCQPIGVRDVLKFLINAINDHSVFNKNFDVGGPDILTYKEMLLGYAKHRKLKRKIITVPIMTPGLSSYWLYYVTSTSYKLAASLVESMKVEVICRNSNVNELMKVEPESYPIMLEKAFVKISSNDIISSWKDAQISGVKHFTISEFIQVPTFGCYKDVKKRILIDKIRTIHKIWTIGDENGWYYANFLWKIRGFLDKLWGGVGLRRGRTNKTELEPGDALDFWRVLYADKNEGRLLLFAEMKLPGEAWLEFKIVKNEIIQTATFRPQGLMGRLYWIAVLPFHGFVFNGMINAIANPKDS
jgi:uncharacterized protein YbjT (DUF2867 family)